MTSQERKQKVIREAYGEHWDKFKYLVDEDGYVKQSDFHWIDADELFRLDREHFYMAGYEMDVIRWRPFPLYGLENNSGWIRIEIYGDIPSLTSEEKYDICWMKEDGNIYDYAVDTLVIHAAWSVDQITHYRVHKEVGPIY